MGTDSKTSIPPPLLPPTSGFKKVLSNRSRTSIQDPGSETSSTQDRRKSHDSTREHSPKDLARHSSRDESSKSGSSGVRKFIPGHAKRKRRRMREAAGFLQPGNESTDSNPAVDRTNAPAPLMRNHSSTSLLQDDNSSLLTDDSEPSS
jgi:hypothetical protein